jgi:acetylornithine deacetylase
MQSYFVAMQNAREILTDLVSYPVLGGESNLSIAEWIERYLNGLGVKVVRVPDADGGKVCLHARIGPPADGGIILSGHTDVVPVAGQPWDTDPFQLTERDGKLYARGSCDMKGFLACCLAAVPHFQRAGLQRPIYLAFSYDEEIGCLAGDKMAGAIRDYYAERPAGAIIGEPTLLRPMVGQKGIMVYSTVVHGSQGHSSRVREEVDAVHEAARLIVWLEEKMESLVAAGRTDDRFTPNHTTIHVGKIRGGSAFNIIANECRFDWDYRTIPRDDADELFADFQRFCRQREEARRTVYPDFRIEHHPFHPAVPPLDTPDDAAVVDLIRQISGYERTGAVAYAAEAGQFARAGFPSVICGPGDIAQAHRANEFVAVEQLDECVMMLERLADRLSRSVR